MACKYKYKNNWYSEEEVLNLLRKENSSFTTLYNNLIKELETSETGRRVFEQVKRDYKYKDFADFDNIIDISKDFKIVPNAGDTDKGKYYLTNNEGENFGNYSLEEIINRFPEYFKPIPYTLEEIQEESIVTLLGLMAADKLDAKKDATLISKLKELWKQISDFVKSLLTGNISENEMSNIIENEVTYTDENNNLCAKDGGRSSKFNKGSKWEIVKDLGAPKFKKGGIWKLYE